MRLAVSTLYSSLKHGHDSGVYACLFEAVCDVTTVPSHLKNKGTSGKVPLLSP